jgi:hypothetical protein
MHQPVERRRVGRPGRFDLAALLEAEHFWVTAFAGMRDGVRPGRVEVRGGSGILIKSGGSEHKIFIDSPDGTVETTGREALYSHLPGEQPRAIRQPKILSGEEMQSWQQQSQQFEDSFRRLVMGDEVRIETSPAISDERELWEELKRARTGAQVRRIYARSKIWLVHRRDFPTGGYIDWSWSPFPKALYDYATEFCRAKLDRRYPQRDQRESGDYRRIEYLARAMAGLSVWKPISTCYSVQLLRKLKHPDFCLCWRCQYEIAPRFPRSLARFFMEQK